MHFTGLMLANSSTMPKSLVADPLNALVSCSISVVVTRSCRSLGSNSCVEYIWKNNDQKSLYQTPLAMIQYQDFVQIHLSILTNRTQHKTENTDFDLTWNFTGKLIRFFFNMQLYNLWFTMKFHMTLIQHANSNYGDPSCA